MDPKVPAETSGGPPPAPSPTAKRMRIYRQRRRKGLVSARLLLSVPMIEALIGMVRLLDSHQFERW